MWVWIGKTGKEQPPGDDAVGEDETTTGKGSNNKDKGVAVISSNSDIVSGPDSDSDYEGKFSSLWFYTRWMFSIYGILCGLVARFWIYASLHPVFWSKRMFLEMLEYLTWGNFKS